MKLVGIIVYLVGFSLVVVGTIKVVGQAINRIRRYWK